MLRIPCLSFYILVDEKSHFSLAQSLRVAMDSAGVFMQRMFFKVESFFLRVQEISLPLGVS